MRLEDPSGSGRTSGSAIRLREEMGLSPPVAFLRADSVSEEFEEAGASLGTLCRKLRLCVS